jgi:hypothetical protein
MKENNAQWIGLVMLILILICAFLLADQRDELKEEAVKRGYAEWIVIRRDNVQFKWKEAKE